MLDQSESEPVDEVADTEVGDETPETVVIAIEGEDPEPDEDAEVEAELGEKGRNAVRALRAAAKRARAEARELKAKLEAKEAPPVVDELGPRPVIADYEFNDDKHAEALIAWNEKKRQRDAQVETEKATAKQREDAYRAKLAKYHDERAKIGVDDDLQAKVVAALSEQQQAALMDASVDPAKVVAALARTPKVLAELSDIKEIHKFTYRLAQIEGRITMTTKTPPPPETKLRAGVAVPAGNLAAQLEAAEKRAEQTGDRTEVIRLRKQMRGA